MGAGSCQKCPDNSYTTRGRCPSTGGSIGTGDSTTSSSGGSTISTGGKVSDGGSISMGGTVTTGGTTSCPVVVLPTPNITEKLDKSTKSDKKIDKSKKESHKLNGWKPSNNPFRSHSTLERIDQRIKLQFGIKQGSCNSWPIGPNYALDQDDSPYTHKQTGSCTGNAGVGMIAWAPLLLTVHYNQKDALDAYQGGTCKDNGCKTPCTCASCPNAFCPQTGANDIGSTGASVDQWMTEQGWMKGYSTADTVNALIAGVALSACELGSPWYDSMMAVSSSCELIVNTKSILDGGHEYDIIYNDGTYFWIRNSWGDKNDNAPWGCCRTNSMGITGCGYAKISRANIQVLFSKGAEGNCPDL